MVKLSFIAINLINMFHILYLKFIINSFCHSEQDRKNEKFNYCIFPFTFSEFERDGLVDKALYGSVIVEHRHRVEDQDEESEVVHDIVGCMLYSKMYYALIGQTYLLQGLYLKPAQKGNGSTPSSNLTLTSL